MNKILQTALLTFVTAFASLSSYGDVLTGNLLCSGPESRAEYAFDGNAATSFSSDKESFAYVGMELDTPTVITKIGWMQSADDESANGMILGCFQGANNADFSDALPILLIKEASLPGEMTYMDIQCSRSFKYVRYVGPSQSHAMVAELEFYGVVGEGDDSALYQPTNLPLVVVNTQGMEWFNGDKEYAMEGSTVYVIDNGEIDVNASAQIRGRGNASWTFPKKPFRIKFDKKQKVLGGPAKCKKWTMINNYGDKTLMRNRLAFDISEKIGMAFTPACHFVDLIFNGEYQGTYQLCDQVEVNPGRVEIVEMDKNCISGESLTGGYLVEIDEYADSEPTDEWFMTDSKYSVPVTIKSPDPGIEVQYNYIKSRMSEMIQSICADNYTDPDFGYRRYLDLDSFLRYFIVNELAGNTDAFFSTFMTLDRGAAKFMTGPVWDFDLGFDNDRRTYPINDKPLFLYRYGSYAGEMRPIVRRIIEQDEKAKQQLSLIWSMARELQNLDEETFSNIISEYEDQLDESQRLNFVRWPILNQAVHQNPMARGSFKAEVDNVRNYLTRRFAKLDELIGRVELPSTVISPDLDDTDNIIGIYTITGQYVGTDLDTLTPGLYIIRQGTKATKHLIK